MKKIFKKLMVLGLVGAVLAENVTFTNAAPTTEAEGLLPISESEYRQHLAEPTTDIANLKSSIDLSTSKYFPNIGSQGNLPSCAAFSGVYYQFTYEANKLNDINSKDLKNCYSPKWMYNALNSCEKRV